MSLLPYIVVGGGLAGTLAALRLVQAGQPVWLWDAGLPGAASPAAAGLFNPLTGPHATPSWQAAELLQELYTSFAVGGPAAQFARYLHPMPIYRPFLTAEQANTWAATAANPAIQHLVSIRLTPWQPNYLHNPMGGLVIQAGWLQVPKMLQGAHHWLMRQPGCKLIQQVFPYQDLNPSNCQLRHKGQLITYKAVIYCEGAAAHANPYLPLPPPVPLKGQLLLLQTNLPALEQVVIQQGYLLPTPLKWPQLGWAAFGATHEHHFTTQGPTEEARAQLLQQFERLFPTARVLAVGPQRAGLRPTTADRRAYIGAHPTLPNMYFFNGLGTKGVLQAPYFSRLLVAHILQGQSIPPATAWQRPSLTPSPVKAIN